uniref:Lysosomal acid phosphatase n=1 Tax=Acrobeloides nanus TaxID=290746 RepID=A0A914CVB5_9BILA
MPVYGDLLEKYRPEVEFLAEKTGLEIDSVYIFQKVLDGIKTRAGLPEILPLPSWANDAEFIERVIKLHNALHASFIDIFLDSIGGWHHDQIVARFDEAIQNTTNHKMILYSSHDTNLMTLGRLLNLTYLKDHLPDFASYVSLELHEINDNFTVQIWFHPNLNESRIELGIPGCPQPCMFSQFSQLAPRVTTGQWKAKCSGPDPSVDTRCTLYGSIAGALVVFIILILGALLSVLWSCLAYRNKYNRLSDPERHKLLN